MTRFLLGLTGLSLVLGLAGAASAQSEADRARAREHFTTGVARFEANDYQGALEQFQEAYRIAPHPSVRVNMANCYEQLGRPLEAMHHFEGFLAESESPTPQQRREVQAAIRRLRGQLGELRLTIAPDGALVTIDGAETRRAPVLEAILLDRGTHRIEVRMDGFETHRQEIDIAGGDSQRVAVSLERPGTIDPVVASTDPDPVQSDPDVAADDPPPETNATGTADADVTPIEEVPEDGGGGGWSFQLTAPVLIAGITTVVFAAGALTAGLLALDYNSQFDAAVLLYENPRNMVEQMRAQEEGLAAADSANTASILADVFMIGAIAALGATVFFVIVDGMDSEDAMAARPGQLAVSGAVTDEGGAVTLLGRF